MVLTEKISLDLPVLYVAVIDFDLVDEGKFKSRTSFIEQAIREKLNRDGIDLVPKGNQELKPDWDKSDLPRR